MKARGYVELTTTELPDELQFVAVRYFGWVELIGPVFEVLYIFMFLWLAWWGHDRWTPLWLAFALISFLFFLFQYFPQWIHGRTTTLRVTANGLQASGNLGNLLATSVEVTASEVASIRYQASPDWITSGVYFKRGKTNIRDLTGLRYGPGNEVIDLIFRRFPQFKPIDDSPAARLFGGRTALAALESSNPPGGDLTS